MRLNKNWLCVVAVTGFLFLMNNVFAKQVVDFDELKNFVDSGVKRLEKSKDKDAVYKEFSNPKGKFIKSGKYIFVYDFDGKCLAHGGDPSYYVGKNLLSLKDRFGVAIIPLLIDVAKDGGGFSGFYLTNPKK